MQPLKIQAQKNTDLGEYPQQSVARLASRPVFAEKGDLASPGSMVPAALCLSTTA